VWREYQLQKGNTSDRATLGWLSAPMVILMKVWLSDPKDGSRER
jgi:hypothetical protein